jgi:ABC-2 type transport system permease protein
MIIKEFQQLRRDKKMRAIIFIAPIVQLLVLGYAANMDVKDVPTAVCDQDRSADSRGLVQAFTSSGSFLVSSNVDSMKKAQDELISGGAELALVIPRGFASDLHAGRTAQLQILVDGSRSNTAAVALAYSVSIATEYGRHFAHSSIRVDWPSLDARPRIWYNPELKSRNFMVPGVFAMIIMVLTIILTSLAIVKEKEIGTLEQLIVTPLKKGELIVGKLTPFLIISLVIVSVALLASALFFGLAPRGSILLLMGLSLAFVVATLGIGLLVSTFARTQQQAMMYSIFFFIFPMMILSGFVFPVDNMPEPIRSITYLMPLRYYLVIVRGIFLKGSDLPSLWPQLLPLLAIGAAVISISIARFRKQMD